jgi:hypothetical protein
LLLFQVGCAFLDFAAAQPTLNQGVSAFVEMQDDVGFQSAAAEPVRMNWACFWRRSISIKIGGKICGKLTVRFAVKWR